MKTAIITGITGQDGAYLAELFLGKGYKVFGTYRRTSTVNFWRIEELGISKHPDLHLVEYDLTDLSASIRLLQTTEATEVYNLAAQSFVGVSFDQPITTAEITGLGPVNLLEAIRIVNPKVRFYQASTSAFYGCLVAGSKCTWRRARVRAAYCGRTRRSCLVAASCTWSSYLKWRRGSS